ncbi:MAG: aminotransferase class I/II-fold pyridoxal phosphate-dependent enzyme [Synechococcales bacterium]|nr:aminotransferase class I/II-fold pyridoxal phosphate-dependent enzyme [Synechococcales bacterium]
MASTICSWSGWPSSKHRKLTAMPLSQDQTPLVDALKASATRPHAPFYTPGHKRGQGIAPGLKALLGADVFRADLPELPELDNLFAPEGAIREAQELATEAFGSDRTWFLVNGSTCGIEAAILATCRPGDKIIVPRNLHQSVISGLILSGASPVFVQPGYDPAWDMAHSPTVGAIATALETHPDAKAVLVVYPTYYGTGDDLEAIAHRVHQANLPLLVDEAHGPHFAFHPDLPSAALAAGADLSVQSTHKVLAGLTQAAMLHIRGDRLDPNRLSKALQLTQSTSPSYLLLASLDAARQQMALHGKALLTQTLQLAHQTRAALGDIPGLRVFDLDPAHPIPGCTRLDLTRLTVDVTGLGLTGFDADTHLHERLGVTAELPALKTLTFILSLGNTPADIAALTAGFQHLASHPAPPIPHLPIHPPALPPLRLTPRQAFFAPTETVAIAQASHRISAELICPYPPGIPVLFPGEEITPGAIAQLQQLQAAGCDLTGCADPALATVRVVADGLSADYADGAD